MRSRIALIAALACAAGPGAAQMDFEAAEIKTTNLGAGLYMMEGLGGNIGVSVGEDGVLLIDDQFGKLNAKIKAAVAEITNQPVIYVLNTHWHFDHTGGNEAFGAAGAVIVAHDNVRVRMNSAQVSAVSGDAIPPSPEEALPVITFSQSATLHFNGHEIHIFHPGPGHTDGDSVVHVRTANVIHGGDLAFNGMYPFIDTTSGGDIDGFIASLEEIVARADADTKIIPGHGPLADRADMEASLTLIKEARRRIQALVAQGLSREDVVAARPLADLDPQWASAFLDGDRVSGILYDLLTKD